LPGFTLQPRMSLETQPSADNPTAVGPPRFTLRTMLLAVAALGCLFGVMSALGTVWSVAILLFGCLVAGHVLGNSLGTRLRDGAPKRSGVSPTRQDARFAATHRSAVEGSGLSRRTRLSRITLVMAFGGATAGAFLGGTGLAAIYPDAGAAAVALGVVSSAVLGGFVGFLTSSFLSVTLKAWREALAQTDPIARGAVERRAP
jgi:hypothetical protein